MYKSVVPKYANSPQHLFGLFFVSFILSLYFLEDFVVFEVVRHTAKLNVFEAFSKTLELISYGYFLRSVEAPATIIALGLIMLISNPLSPSMLVAFLMV
ncbi:hypothetical protein Ltuc_0820 [Legionella tucsonensis]|uniref:Uncharacterized protein n=1 Tax=Legionella tucsonensis TaxID=40335 RepID=A0A0W0ZUX1_9GAMM|nr:hypothetical protein Ltuc_0820 [Legionella tucsonensis]